MLQAGGDIALVAGRDATLTAAGVYSEDGGIALSAGRDVNLLAAQEQHDLTIDEQRKKKGLFSSKTTTTHDEWHESLAVGTTLSGESVQIAAGRDLTAQGAQIAGTGDVLLAAGRDLTLTTAENTYSESHDKTVKKSGLFSGGGIGFTIGKQRADTTADITDITHTGTLVGSTSGRMDIVAGRDVGITGSDVLSQAGIGIVGQNVTIEAAQDSSHTVETQKFRQSGINVSLKGGAVDTAMAVKNSVDRAGQVQDDRLAALHLAQAGQTLLSGGQAGLNSLKGAGDQFDALANTTDTKATGNNGLSLRIGIGASKSSSSVEYNATTAAGSRIASEGDIAIHATGDGKGNGGDLTVTGSRIEGDNVTLAAANDLVLKAQQETREQVERNKASSGEVGVTLGSEAGIGVYVSASAAKGKGDGSGTTHAETTVEAANTLTLVSGRDTTLEGAQAKGETVIADIGRNLTLTSQQDTNDYRRKDQSAGIDAAVGTGGGQISANYNQSRIDSTYTSVKEQAGIQAGEGGFDIRVGGHTQLDGAAIASTADASLNRLETGSLGWSDLHNEAEYTASSVGGSVSGGTGGGSVSPNISVPQHEKSGSTTQAGIADGTLIVHDGSGEGIARGVTELQQDGLKDIFDQQKVAERMEMGQVAGQVGMRAAGDLAQKMGWEEGSKEKVILHGIVGAAIAALGGSDALSGLAGAAANQLASKAMQDYLRGNDIDPNSVEGRLLMELGSVAVGAAVGGGSGAASALAGEQFNRQLHWDDFLEKFEACQSAPGESGCAAILEMGQDTESYPISMASDAAKYGVVANKNKITGEVVSYTILDEAGVPRLIMQNDECNSFVVSGVGPLTHSFAPSYGLDYGSAFLHALNGNYSEAGADLKNVFSSGDYWRDMAISLTMSAAAIKPVKEIKLVGGAYEGGGFRISKSYYERLWGEGRPAPFLQAKEILNSSPKISPDPRGMTGYYKFESSGLEMTYNPKTGDIWHIQPVRGK